MTAPYMTIALRNQRNSRKNQQHATTKEKKALLPILSYPPHFSKWPLIAETSRAQYAPILATTRVLIKVQPPRRARERLARRI